MSASAAARKTPLSPHRIAHPPHPVTAPTAPRAAAPPGGALCSARPPAERALTCLPLPSRVPVPALGEPTARLSHEEATPDDRMTDRLTDWLTDWLPTTTAWLTDCLTTDWLTTDWLLTNYCLTTDWLTTNHHCLLANYHPLFATQPRRDAPPLPRQRRCVRSGVTGRS